MTGKTRYFLVGSALVFFVGLSIGLVAFYGGLPKGLFGKQAGPAELSMVPSEAAVVAYADVKQVMGSDLRQRLRQFGGPSDEGRAEIKTSTGIDIENDIDYVVAYMMGAPGGDQQAEGLVLARGRFDRARLETFAKEKGATIEDYKGKRLIKPPVKTAASAEAEDEAEIKAEKAGAKIEALVEKTVKAEGARPHGSMAVGFLEDGLVALGSEASVKRAIDGLASGKTARDNAEMMKLVADVSDAGLWAVGHFEAISAQAKLPQEVSSRIPPITWFSAAGHVNGGVQVMMKAETKDDASATNLRDMVRGFIALAKLQAGNRPEAAALWPTVEMGGTGKTVSLSFGVSSQLIDVMAPKKKAAPAAPAAPAKDPKAPEKK